MTLYHPISGVPLLLKTILVHTPGQLAYSGPTDSGSPNVWGRVRNSYVSCIVHLHKRAIAFVDRAG
jgi:hypothetical protein